jgi:hypothetical protein
MKNLFVKCIETFQIYIFLTLKSFKWRDCYTFLFLRVHIKFFNFLHGFFLIKHMFKNIHRLIY